MKQLLLAGFQVTTDKKVQILANQFFKSMPSLKKIFTPDSYTEWAQRWQQTRTGQINLENWKALNTDPPGHFYSPLFDVSKVNVENGQRFDGAEMWEHIDLRIEMQKAFYLEMLTCHPPLPFTSEKNDRFRYFINNPFFCEADAYTLTAVLRHLKPKRIVEVGSGFSSAVTLDTCDHADISPTITFIEPYADRLKSLLGTDDRASSEIIERAVQEVPLGVFDRLEKDDVLFIDSSHVAKVGSDVVHLILRVLPKLRPGVWLHVHDVFYPSTYPITWLKEGRAWNEGLFLRAYLLQNKRIEIVAFNSLAAQSFPEVFKERAPFFLKDAGGSIWLRTI